MFNVLTDRFDEIFYAIPQNQAVIHCPIQPGKLIQYYYGQWVKDGNTLVELPQPINGNPQEIVQSDNRYNLDTSTFSLIINSIEVSDAGDNYQCILNVIDPRNDLPIYLQTSTAYLTLMVNGKPQVITTLHTHSSLVASHLWLECFSIATADCTISLLKFCFFAAEPEILSEIQVNNGITTLLDLDESADDRLPSFMCAAAGLPAPIITWIYVPNLDREHDISLSDGEKYQIIVNNVSEKDDGRQVTTSSLTFLELTATDGGLVRCRASTPTTTDSADALLTVIGTLQH